MAGMIGDGKLELGEEQRLSSLLWVEAFHFPKVLEVLVVCYHLKGVRCSLQPVPPRRVGWDRDALG